MQASLILPEADCNHDDVDLGGDQGGITCGAIDEASRSLTAIEKRVILNIRDKNAVIACFRDKMMFFIFKTKCHHMSWYIMLCHGIS